MARVEQQEEPRENIIVTYKLEPNTDKSIAIRCLQHRKFEEQQLEEEKN